MIHHLHESKDVLRARIIRAHLSSDGKPLAGWSADNQIGRTSSRKLYSGGIDAAQRHLWKRASQMGEAFVL